MTKFTPDAMRKRFHEAQDERKAKLAASGPLREKRKELKRRYQAEIAELDQQIAAAEDGLFDLDMEIGTISKALNGKTGKREDVMS